MSIFYSAARGGFFDPQVHDPMPDDAVAVSPARHRALMRGQENGHQIVPGRGGRPSLRKAERPDLRIWLNRKIQKEAASRIRAVSPEWRQLNDLREPGEAGAARFAAIDAIRAASDLIEQQLAQCAGADLALFPIETHPLWPEID